MATLDHCFYCFDSILEEFGGFTKEPKFANEEYPLFVTWNINQSGELRLRGCIGNFSPLELHSGLKKYAKISAFQDDRFAPIQKHEIENLTCSVSLLHEFEQASNWKDWDVGTHGIRIRLELDRVYSATYLPEVAAGQGWNHIETIDSLLRKSGFKKSIDSGVRESIKLTRYRSSKAHGTFQDYLESCQ